MNTGKLKRISLLLILLPAFRLGFGQTANFEISRSNGCPPLYVSMTNSSSESYSFLWDFGDGYQTQTDSTETIDHLYHQGIYNIKLIAYNLDKTKADTSSKIITVFPAAHSSFSISEISHMCNYDFINTSIGDFFFWDFGDGQSSTESDPSHTFLNYTQEQIEYEIKLISTTELGCEDYFVRRITIDPNQDFCVAAVPYHNYKIMLYPNPADLTLNIETGMISSGIVRIYSIRGAEISSHSLRHPSMKINISGLPEGLYLVVISSNEGKWIEKFTRQR